MRKMFVVAGLLLLTVSVVWAAHPQAPAGKPGEGQWPPAGAYRAGQSGVTMPRVVREVKPQYTPEAQRAMIEGTVVVEGVVEPDGTVAQVHVTKSLDRKFGLDQEAVNAAKQWLFQPGTKDGVAVPVVVSIELNFVLDGARGLRMPALSVWPDAFLSAAAPAVAAGKEWTEEVSEDSGIRVRFSYPEGWTFRKEDAGMRWFGVQDGLRLLIVNRPQPTSARLVQPLNTQQLQQLQDTITASLTAKGSTGRLQETGQIRTPGNLWFWYEVWVPVNDPTFPSDVAARFGRVFEGTSLWAFMTTVGSSEITVGCFVMRPRGAFDADTQEQVRQAGAQFRAMLERMTIEAR